MFHNTFLLSPSEILGNVEHVVEDPDTFRPGVLVCCGQEAVNYLKKFLLSGGTYAATAITSGEGQDGTRSGGDKGKKGQVESGDTCDPSSGKLMRRTELPLYSETHPEKGNPCEEQESSLEKGISAVRKELWVWSDKYQDYKEKVKDVVITGKEHSAAPNDAIEDSQDKILVDQLRKDELPVPRAGAIAISGLAGVVLGLRGGWFRRIIYGSTCAGLMAAVCYPNEVANISEDTVETAKKYILITYNFIYGEKESEPSVRIIQSHECPTTPDGPGVTDAPEYPAVDIMPHECPSEPDGPGVPDAPEYPVFDIMPHECPSKPDGPGVPDAPEYPAVEIMPHECPSKPDGPGVPDAPEYPVVDIMPHECPTKPDGPGLEPMPEPTPEPIPEDPGCACPLTPVPKKSEQSRPFKSSFRSHFDRFAEDSADVKKTSRPNDQSNPADKDLYSSKR